MKITKVTVLAPEIKQGASVGVRIYTDEGIYGDAEVAGINRSDAVFGMIKDIAPLVIGRNPLDNEVIWDDVYRNGFCGLNGGQTFFSALGAVDIALWDIKGKAFGLPVYQLLGGKKRSRLRAYASQLAAPWFFDKQRKDEESTWAFASTTPEGYAQNAKECVELGFDCVKTDFFQMGDGGKYLSGDDYIGPLTPKRLNMIEERLAATREAVGKDVDIIIENHAHPDLNAAIQIGRMAEKYNIMFFEEPTTPSPILTKAVHDAINIPIAHGERIISRWEYIPYFQDGSIQMIQPDLGNCGGITEVKKICDMAYAYGVGVQLHVCGSHMMTPAALHLEAVLPNFIIHEHHICNNIRDIRALTTKVYDDDHGSFVVPEEPGIGNEWSEEALRCEKQVTFTI